MYTRGSGGMGIVEEGGALGAALSSKAPETDLTGVLREWKEDI